MHHGEYIYFRITPREAINFLLDYSQEEQLYNLKKRSLSDGKQKQFSQSYVSYKCIISPLIAWSGC